MEAAFGRLHNSGAGTFGARPTVVESIMVDGEIDGYIYGAQYILAYMAPKMVPEVIITPAKY